MSQNGGMPLEGTCFHCGVDTRQGGIWHGSGYNVTVCPNEECMRALLHTVYDAMRDVMSLDSERRLVRRYWKDLTGDVLREKGRIT